MLTCIAVCVLATAVAGGWGVAGTQGADLLRTAEGYIISFFEWFGELGGFCRRLVRGVFARPFEGRELIRQMDAIGSKSLPLVALAGAATGVVLSMQTRDSLTRFGAKAMLPSVIAFSLMKERSE